MGGDDSAQLACYGQKWVPSWGVLLFSGHFEVWVEVWGSYPVLHTELSQLCCCLIQNAPIRESAMDEKGAEPFWDKWVK